MFEGFINAEIEHNEIRLEGDSQRLPLEGDYQALDKQRKLPFYDKNHMSKQAYESALLDFLILKNEIENNSIQFKAGIERLIQLRDQSRDIVLEIPSEVQRKVYIQNLHVRLITASEQLFYREILDEVTRNPKMTQFPILTSEQQFVEQLNNDIKLSKNKQLSPLLNYLENIKNVKSQLHVDTEMTPEEKKILFDLYDLLETKTKSHMSKILANGPEDLNELMKEIKSSIAEVTTKERYITSGWKGWNNKIYPIFDTPQTEAFKSFKEELLILKREKNTLIKQQTEEPSLSETPNNSNSLS